MASLGEVLPQVLLGVSALVTALVGAAVYLRDKRQGTHSRESDNLRDRWGELRDVRTWLREAEQEADHLRAELRAVTEVHDRLRRQVLQLGGDPDEWAAG